MRHEFGTFAGCVWEDYISKLNEVTGHKMPNSERIEILQI